MKIWKEFKSFALSGSMLDLALGFIIGTAFATVITSGSDHILTPLISAIFGKANFSHLSGHVNGTIVPYGLFLQDILNFFFFALVLFGILKMISVIGVGRQRVFEERQCPYCMEYVNPEAIVCRSCKLPLVEKLPDLSAAEARAARFRERRRLHLDLPHVDLPHVDLPHVELPHVDLADLRDNIPRRRRGTKTETIGVIPVIPVEVRVNEEED